MLQMPPREKKIQQQKTLQIKIAISDVRKSESQHNREIFH